jgi:hypothetical protein
MGQLGVAMIFARQIWKVVSTYYNSMKHGTGKNGSRLGGPE